MTSKAMLRATGKLMALLLTAAVPGCARSAPALSLDDPRSPLRLVRRIALPQVSGRIDHMALDPAGDHLFVAEYGNGSVDDIDLASGKVAGRIGGLHEPQGIAWLPAEREIAVTSADGRVTFYRSSDRQQVAAIDLGSDADNVRVDGRNGDLVVGYGSGGLTVIDPKAHRVIGRVPLPAHPEAFEIVGATAFVNVPDAHKIAIADLDRGRLASTVDTGLRFGNFPMAADPAASRIAIAFRTPATLAVLDARTLATILSSPLCGDADDLYFRAGQLVVVCGSGAIELVDTSARHRRVSVATASGARTGLLDPSGRRLFVAVPARGGPASIWELAFR